MCSTKANALESTASTATRCAERTQQTSERHRELNLIWWNSFCVVSAPPHGPTLICHPVAGSEWCMTRCEQTHTFGIRLKLTHRRMSTQEKGVIASRAAAALAAYTRNDWNCHCQHTSLLAWFRERKWSNKRSRRQRVLPSLSSPTRRTRYFVNQEHAAPKTLYAYH